jgi:hypothetical protein
MTVSFLGIPWYLPIRRSEKLLEHLISLHKEHPVVPHGVYKLSVNSFTNPYSIYSHPYFMTVLSECCGQVITTPALYSGS